jgi:hypothetical protein
MLTLSVTPRAPHFKKLHPAFLEYLHGDGYATTELTAQFLNFSCERAEKTT